MAENDMLLDGDIDDSLDSLVVNTADVQGQVIEALQYYLSGRWDEERTWARLGPLYEFSASPTAEQAMQHFFGYVCNYYDKTELKRRLGKMTSEMKNAGH